METRSVQPLPESNAQWRTFIDPALNVLVFLPSTGSLCQLRNKAYGVPRTPPWSHLLRRVLYKMSQQALGNVDNTLKHRVSWNSCVTLYLLRVGVLCYCPVFGIAYRFLRNSQLFCSSTNEIILRFADVQYITQQNVKRIDFFIIKSWHDLHRIFYKGKLCQMGGQFCVMKHVVATLQSKSKRPQIDDSVAFHTSIKHYTFWMVGVSYATRI